MLEYNIRVHDIIAVVLSFTGCYKELQLFIVQNVQYQVLKNNAFAEIKDKHAHVDVEEC